MRPDDLAENAALLRQARQVITGQLNQEETMRQFQDKQKDPGAQRPYHSHKDSVQNESLLSFQQLVASDTQSILPFLDGVVQQIGRANGIAKT